MLKSSRVEGAACIGSTGSRALSCSWCLCAVGSMWIIAQTSYGKGAELQIVRLSRKIGLYFTSLCEANLRCSRGGA